MCWGGKVIVLTDEKFFSYLKKVEFLVSKHRYL